MGTRVIGATIDLKDPNTSVNRYITRITDTGITIHPEDTSNNNYIQLDGTGMYIKDSTGISLAKFANNDLQMGRDDEWNVKIVNNGVYIVNPESEHVATYKDDIIIGKDDGSQSYLYADYHSMQMIDKEGEVYFHVSDLRDKDGNYTEKYLGDGETSTFYFPMYASAITKVTIDNIETPDYTYDTLTRAITLNTPPESGAAIAVTAIPYSGDPFAFKAYTLGIRRAWVSDETRIGSISYAEGFGIVASGVLSHAEGVSTTASGDYSHAEGDMTTASGAGSHAEGRETIASGEYSHAEGYYTVASGASSHAQNLYTIAAKRYQTAIGKYNIQDTETDTSKVKAFIIGNGTSTSQRSNAFTVDWSGNTVASGYIDAKTYTYDYSKFGYASGFTNYSTSGEHSPKACKFGKIVNLSGVIKATEAKTGTSLVQIGTVPTNCKPLYDQHFYNTANNGGVKPYRLTVKTDGKIYADLYTTAIAANHWFNISATYISANADQ